MARTLFICLSICAVLGLCNGVSSKLDFPEEEEETTTITNSTKVDDDNVEVKHTIVVSTKLNNNNRRGLHSSRGDDKFHFGGREVKEDSGEVPVVKGYKSVDSTLIRTPDTRYKNRPGPQMFPESVFINRNIPDEYDIYPNYINNPNQWKPLTSYNNINWLDQALPVYNVGFKNTINSRPAYQTPGKFHRRISDDGMKEFYCNKCRELQGFRGCGQSRSNPWPIVQTTTPKIKLDGKLVKLN